MVAEGAFCVGLGLAGKQNAAFVTQKEVQSHSLGSTLLRLFMYLQQSRWSYSRNMSFLFHITLCILEINI